MLSLFVIIKLSAPHIRRNSRCRSPAVKSVSGFGFLCASSNPRFFSTQGSPGDNFLGLLVKPYLVKTRAEDKAILAASYCQLTDTFPFGS